MKKYLIALFTVIVVSGIVFFILRRADEDILEESLPSPLTYDDVKKTPSISTTPSKTVVPNSPLLPSEVNLDVPFTSQAPYQDWSFPYSDFCEEASALMAASYIKGSPIIDPDDANKKLLEVMAFEDKYFGYHKDTNAEQTAQILKEYYGIKNVVVKYEPSLDDLKRALASGKVIIMPAAGRMLGNPYYRQPGPIYHMLVIKGYTKDGNFITNDPGTRRGENYIYSPTVIMNAMHDWNFGQVESGRKVVIIVG